MRSYAVRTLLHSLWPACLMRSLNVLPGVGCAGQVRTATRSQRTALVSWAGPMRPRETPRRRRRGHLLVWRLQI